MSERLPQRDLVREFLSYIQVEKGLSANTLQSYARDLTRLQAWAQKNGKQVEKLERRDLREWIAGMSREGLAPSSVARSVSAARGFLHVTISYASARNPSTFRTFAGEVRLPANCRSFIIDSRYLAAASAETSIASNPRRSIERCP